MKKQAFIQLHTLLAETARYIAAREEYDAAEPGEVSLYDATESLGIDTYEELGTQPAFVHHAKSRHTEAVQVLADGIDDYLDGGDGARSAVGLEA